MRLVYKTLMLSVVLLIITAGVSTFVYNNTSWIYSESGCLELAQDIILIFSFVAFGCASLMKGNSQQKYITIFFTILSYAFLLREIDFERLDLPEWSVFLFYGKGRNITITLAFTIVAIMALKEWKHYITQSIDFMRSKRGYLMIASALLLVIGGVFEKCEGFSHYEFFEEIFEIAGYIAFSTAALLTYNKYKKEKQ